MNTYVGDYAESLNGDLGNLISKARLRLDETGHGNRLLSLDELIEAITPAIEFRIDSAYKQGRADAVAEETEAARFRG